MTCTIKPSQVYKNKPRLDESKWKIIDFRIPRIGDWYMGGDGFIDKLPVGMYSSGPRFILEERIVVQSGTVDSFWE